MCTSVEQSSTSTWWALASATQSLLALPWCKSSFLLSVCVSDAAALMAHHLVTHECWQPCMRLCPFPVCALLEIALLSSVTLVHRSVVHAACSVQLGAVQTADWLADSAAIAMHCLSRQQFQLGTAVRRLHSASVLMHLPSCKLLCIVEPADALRMCDGPSPALASLYGAYHCCCAPCFRLSALLWFCK